MPSNIREMMEALREAAEKAEPGHWHLYEVGDDPAPCPATEAGTSLLTVVEEDGASFAAVYDRDTANYIALANPQTLTLLLQHVDKLEGMLRGLAGATVSAIEGERHGAPLDLRSADERARKAKAFLEALE